MSPACARLARSRGRLTAASIASQRWRVMQGLPSRLTAPENLVISPLPAR
jgi:hypothetical protein